MVLPRSVAVALMFLLLSAPAAWQRWLGGDTAGYIATTIALALLAAVVTITWRNADAGEVVDQGPQISTSSWPFRISAVFVTAAAAVLLVVASRAWLTQILTIPIDPYRGDMLVVVREGLRRAAGGLNPYTIHHVPWAAPLPYGPVLWGPYALPMLLRVDLRVATLVGELFVPVACAVAAIVAAARGRPAAAAGALLMLAAIALNGSVEQFTSIGHTPVYWPLIALFAWLVVRERWLAAAVALGLLVVARTTMIAIVPVLVMTVWLRERRAFAAVCSLIAASIALPFLPFAIWDPRALIYALYGSYQTVIKTAVWPDATVPHTIGVTGVLLSHHLHRYVEGVQVAIMGVVYVICWRLLRRGRAPIALMGTALLAFSATTLWPVYYIYLDVFLLFAAGVVAETLWPAARSWTPETGVRPGSGRGQTGVRPGSDQGQTRVRPGSDPGVMRGWLLTMAAAVVLVCTTGAAMVSETEGLGTVTWRDAPPHATVLLLRRTISPALVDVHVSAGSGDVRVDVALNGSPLGAVDVAAGAEHVMLAVPASRWQIGANTLELSPSPAIAVRDVAVRPTRSIGRPQP